MTSLTATDPVCGMQVDTTIAVVVEHAGQPHYFCDPACADTFREDPERWIPGAAEVDG